MRTSITLDEETYQVASSYASARRITLGAAIGELVRRGEAAPQSKSIPPGLKRLPNGLLVIAARKGRRVITPELVKKYQEDEIE